MMNRREFLVYSTSLFLISGCGVTSVPVNIDFTNTRSFLEDLEILKSEGGEIITEGFIANASFILIIALLGEDGIQNTKDDDLIPYAKELFSTTDAIMRSRFKVVASVPYSERRRLSHGTLESDWQVVSDIRAALCNHWNKEFSRKALYLMKMMFGPKNYKLIGKH